MNSNAYSTWFLLLRPEFVLENSSRTDAIRSTYTHTLEPICWLTDWHCFQSRRPWIWAPPKFSLAYFYHATNSWVKWTKLYVVHTSRPATYNRLPHTERTDNIPSLLNCQLKSIISKLNLRALHIMLCNVTYSFWKTTVSSRDRI